MQAGSKGLNPNGPHIPTFAEYFIERSQTTNTSKLLDPTILKKITSLMGEEKRI